MLELLIVVLVVLWLLGYFGPAVIPRIPRTGNFLHVLLVVVVILIIVRLVTWGARRSCFATARMNPWWVSLQPRPAITTFNAARMCSTSKESV